MSRKVYVSGTWGQSDEDDQKTIEHGPLPWFQHVQSRYEEVLVVPKFHKVWNSRAKTHVSDFKSQITEETMIEIRLQSTGSTFTNAQLEDFTSVK